LYLYAQLFYRHVEKQLELQYIDICLSKEQRMGTESITAKMFQQFEMNPTGFPMGPKRIGDAWNFTAPWDCERSEAFFSQLNALVERSSEGNAFLGNEGRFTTGSTLYSHRKRTSKSYRLSTSAPQRIGTFERSIEIERGNNLSMISLTQDLSTPPSALLVGLRVYQEFRVDPEQGYSHNFLHMNFDEADAAEFFRDQQLGLFCMEDDSCARHPIAMATALAAVALHESLGGEALPVENLVFKRSLAGDKIESSLVARNAKKHSLRLERGGVHVVAHPPFGEGLPDEVDLSIPRRYFGEEAADRLSASERDKTTGIEILSDKTHYVVSRTAGLDAMPLLKIAVMRGGRFFVSALLLQRIDEKQQDTRKPTHYHMPIITQLFHFLEDGIERRVENKGEEMKIGDIFAATDGGFYLMP
jgi:hypothetical protein